MSKIAFLYPGQGSQKVGMGSELQTGAPELFANYLERSNTATGVPVTQYCLEGPQATLSQTHVAQPALFAHSLALTDYARQLGLEPTMVAGHSLGEYTAAVAVGALSFEDGLHLVSQRGKLMHQVQDEHPGAMAAIVGMAVEVLHELWEKISHQHLVTVTNWNTHTQFVVSGAEEGVLALMDAATDHKNVRAVRLATRGAFHSPLMQPVQAALESVMQHLAWHHAHTPLVANVSGKAITQDYHIRHELITQITHPVQWVRCVETMIESGCDTFIELGASQVLTRLVRSIAPESRTFSADTLERVAAVAATLNSSSPAYAA